MNLKGVQFFDDTNKVVASYDLKTAGIHVYESLPVSKVNEFVEYISNTLEKSVNYVSLEVR